VSLPAAKLALAVKRARAQSGAAELLNSEPIAVIGMGCRLPGKVDSPDAFWKLLQDGVDAIVDLPRGRWGSSVHVPRCQGGFLDEVTGFDAEFFGIPPRESEQLDPQHRLLMEVVWESLWNARLRPDGLAGSRSGVFVAVYNNDYLRLQFSHPGNINAYTSSGTSHSTAVGRISFLLDWKGPSIAIDTACSSSLVAIHLACQSLRAGECQMAVAGGVSLILAPEELISLTKLGMLASDWRCKTFDSRADGFVPGEGCGIIVLKRLSDALTDGDTIRAVIRGTAVNQDGRTTVLTAPNGLSQQTVIRNALANAQVSPSEISYIEAHGTGTVLGDPIEVEALSEVLAGEATQPCYLGSVKTNFGHLEAAAGVSGVIKTVLALEHEQIPKSLHFQRLNPHISLDGTRLVIADRALPWPRGPASRFAGVSSFGYGGTNAHVVLEDAPLFSAAQRAPVTPHSWKRQRYWSVAQPAAVEVRTSVHPLLGHRLSSPAIEGTVFENTLSADSPSFLGDHTPGGRTLLPLSACIEMFLAASGGSVIEDVVVQESVELAPSKPCQVQVIVKGEILQLFSLDNGNWKLHASARTVTAGQKLSPANLEEFRCPAGRQSHADEFYAALEARGLQFGPAFRLIEAVWINESGALARVRPPESANGYRLHPALLDACFQSLGALLPKDGIYLPLGLRRFELFRAAPSGGLWCRATLQPGPRGSVVGDLAIFDSEGQPVASAQGLWLRRPDAGDAEPCLCEVQWESKPRTAGPESAVSGNWLVLTDAGGVGLSVAAGLEAAGAHCLTMSRGEKFEELLRTVPMSGIVYLWALDAAPLAEMDDTTLRRQTREACEPVLELVRELGSKAAEPPRVWIVTRNAQAAGILHTGFSLAQSPLWGLARCVRREHPELRCVTIDLDSDPHSAERLLDEIRYPDGEQQIAFRGENRLVHHLARLNGPSEPVRLSSEAPGRLEELRWKPFARRKPGRGEVEIRIAASGLNFRDVLNALGEYPGEAGPLGSECSGWIEDVGEGVTGLNLGQEVVAVARGGFAKFVTTKADLVAVKPAELGMEEAAAIPVAYVTVRYALVTVGKLQAGQKVLIHAAAGGVGLAAIAEAQRLGAEIFATAGSDEKRAWLRSLGVRHIMNSRALDYGREILEQTGGRGVDVVLNSMSGDHIAESLGVLAPGGIYLELGKKGIWDAERVAGFRQNVRYAVIEWGEEYERSPELIAGIYRSIIEDVQNGVLPRLPCKTFPEKEVVHAFRWMAQARHIGKIVVRQDTGPKPLRHDAAYLITGGTGALGLQVAGWMAAHGAGELVLVGRSDPDESAIALIRAMEKTGARVLLRRVDVSRKSEVERLIQEIHQSGKTLRGIVHAAGVLDDGVLTQQTWERFEKVMAPKLDGAWHLHEVTKGMELDFFIMFSSLASLLGSPGQANYSSANAFLDGLAHYRRSLGLPALSINWGPWQGGMAIRPGAAGWQRSFPTLRALESEQGFEFLERFLHDELPAQIAAFLLRSKASVRDLESGPVHESASHTPDSTEVARTVARSATLRGPELLNFLRQEVGKIMGISDATLLPPEKPLFEAGLDSLMAVEFRNVLADVFGRTFPSTLLFDYPSLQKLSLYLQGAGDKESIPENIVELGDLDESAAEALLNAELNRKN